MIECVFITKTCLRQLFLWLLSHNMDNSGVVDPFSHFVGHFRGMNTPPSDTADPCIGRRQVVVISTFHFERARSIGAEGVSAEDGLGPLRYLQQERVHLLLQDGLHQMRIAADVGGNLT